MKISEAVEHMTKFYLHRVIESFTRDFPKHEDEESRHTIVRNSHELADPARVQAVLGHEELYSEQVLASTILEALINRQEYRAHLEDIVLEVQALERGVIEEAADPEAFKHEDDWSLEILRAVLEVALEDEALVPDELSLIRRLREKLGIRDKTKRLLLAQLNHFPRTGNRVHSHSEVNEALNDLQRRGIVFHCNRLDKGRYVLPEEMVEPVKDALGIQMTRRGWEKLLSHLPGKNMEAILKQADLPRGGTKEEKSERIRRAGIQPTEALDALSSGDLYHLLRSLPGAKVTGGKEERSKRILAYFDQMVYKDVPAEATDDEIYYQYLTELAGRKREILLANSVIRKDQDMNRAFEQGTEYLFREKLGLELVDQDGSEHSDGCVVVPGREYVLMWDNKSKEGTYNFPPSHLKQFKRYIRECAERVGCFLIITAEVTAEAEKNAARLKADSGADTDVALITAEDLRWVAEEWSAQGAGEEFNPEVFNITGILDRNALETRMSLFL